MEKIKSVQNELATLEDKVSRLEAKAQQYKTATDTVKPLKIIEHSLLVFASDIERECLLELDGVLSDGDQTIRQARKHQVLRAKQLIDKCDKLRADVLGLIDRKAQEGGQQQETQAPRQADPQDEGGKKSQLCIFEKENNKEELEDTQETESEEDCTEDINNVEDEEEAEWMPESEEDCTEDINNEEEEEEAEWMPDPTKWSVKFIENERRDGGVDLIADVRGVLPGSISVASLGGGEMRVRAFKPVSQCRGIYKRGTFGQLDQTFRFPPEFDVAGAQWRVDQKSSTLIITTTRRRSSRSFHYPTHYPLPSRRCNGSSSYTGGWHGVPSLFGSPIPRAVWW